MIFRMGPYLQTIDWISAIAWPLLIIIFATHMEKTNKRVKKLEEEIKQLRDMKENKWSYRYNDGPKYAPGDREMDRL